MARQKGHNRILHTGTHQLVQAGQKVTSIHVCVCVCNSCLQVHGQQLWATVVPEGGWLLDLELEIKAG